MNGSRPEANPFVGPRPFEPGERIYGREREIGELYFRLNAERVVLLHSPSGAGKSSLVQAGLLPLLHRSFDVWGPTRVNAEPAVAGANRYLLSTMQGFEEGVPESLRRPPEALAEQTLASFFEQRPRRRSASPNVVLLFDQFEEILTVDPLAADAKHAFFDQLGELLRNPRVWALFALREDYLAPLDPYAPQVPTQLKNRFRIDLLGLTAAREAIVQPALEGGREFPAVDMLVKDLATMKVQQADGTFVKETGQHVEPVQLQVVCRRLWDAMPPEDLSIEAEDLERFGDVTEALGAYYADAVARIAGGDPVQERAVRDWFGEALITAGGIRGQVLYEAEASGGLANGLVRGLLDTHLVRAEKRAGATWYELAHDRLIEPVQSDNAAWQEKHLTEAQRQAVVWERQGRPPRFLLTGAALAEALRWEAENPARATLGERRFLAESRKAQEQLDAEHRQARGKRRLVWGAVLTLLVALIAAGVTWYSYRTLQQEARRSASRELALQSAQLLDKQLDLAVLLALEANRLSPTPEARRSLFTAMQHNPRLWRFLPGRSDTRRKVAFWAGGPVLAAAGESDAVELWNPFTGTPLPGSPLRLSEAFEVRAVAISPDGRWLAAGGKTAENAGLLGLWDLSATPPRRHSTPRLETVVRGLAFCGQGEGTRLAWITKDGLSLWALGGTAEPRRLRQDPRSRFASLALTADCARLAVGHEWDTGIDLWDLTAPSAAAEPRVLGSEGSPGSSGSPGPDQEGIHSLAFGPAGQRLAAGTAREGALLWDLRTLESEHLHGVETPVRGLAFRSDGRVLAGAAGGAGIILWDLETRDLETGQTAVEILAEQDSPVTGVAFNRRGDVLASAGEDGKVILWMPDRTQRLGRELRKDGNPVWALSFSPDSRWLVSAEGWSEDQPEAASDPSGESGTVRLWNLRTGKGTVLPGNPGPSRAVAFSPDGRSIAAGSRGTDGFLHLWHLEGPERKPVEAARWQASKKVNALVFGPAGKSLFAAEGPDLVQWSLGPKPPTSRTLATHAGNIWSLLFRRADGSLLASDETGTIQDWDVATGGSKALLAPSPPTPQILAAVAESPDGSFAAAASWVGGTRCVYLWEMPAGTFLGCLAGHKEPVSAVVFTPRGSLVSADQGGLLIVWDPQTRQEIGRLELDGTVNGLAASPDGLNLAAASSDGKILLLDLSWKTAVHNLAGRELTSQECETWIHFDPKPPACTPKR